MSLDSGDAIILNEMFFGTVSISLKKLWISAYTISLLHSTAIFAGANPTQAMLSILNGKATHLPRFFEELDSSVEHFFNNPSDIYLVDKNAPNRSPNNFANGLIKNVINVPMCESRSSSVSKSITASYNSADASKRKNFFVAASACLAAHEGAELLANNMNATKLDTSDAKYVKYLYGSFQLSTENGGGLQEACLKIWNKSFPAKAIKFSDKSSGTKKNSSAHQLFGRAENQTFNHFCGVHEFFRAAFAGSRSNKCFDIFNPAQSRYGPLRTRSAGFTDCLETMGRTALQSGDDINQLKENFANAQILKSSVVAENDNSRKKSSASHLAGGVASARLSVPLTLPGPAKSQIVIPSPKRGILDRFIRKK